MEHLPRGVEDTEGCYVFQINDGKKSSISVRSEQNVSDEFRTKEVFYDGEMVSVDLVRPSRLVESRNGPFLRLSDSKGWLFQKKYGDVMVTKIPVSVGLWSFIVGSAISLRRHPVDRADMIVEGVVYQPMQKIHCDRKVQHPLTRINFYRVQGTEGWVFDRRDEDYKLLNENMVKFGVFVYKNIHSSGRIGIRITPEVGDSNRTEVSLGPGELVSVNAVQKSPFSYENGPFLRLTDGSGWVFEKIRNEQLMIPLFVNEGEWDLKVLNSPAGIALRRHPVDSPYMLYDDVSYIPGEIIRCTHMIQASSGVKFYRVEGTEGWAFDKRNDYNMLTLLSEESSNGNCRNGWSPDFVREVAAMTEGVIEISFIEPSRVISFRNTVSDVRINVYYKTQTIGTALIHPSQGRTQLFRRNCTTQELKNVFRKPRAHTGKGYKQRRIEPPAFAPLEVIQSPYGQGLMADQEAEIRNALLELDKETVALNAKKQLLLQRIRDADLSRAKEANRMKLKIEERTQARAKDKRKRKALELRNQRNAQAEARELQSRTCEACSRVFQNWHAKQQHYRAVHIIACDHCDREFSNPYSLRQHQEALGHW